MFSQLTSRLTKLLRQRIAPASAGPTWDELLAEYLNSSHFRSLAIASQKAYRPVMERWVRDAGLGPLPVPALTRPMLEASLVGATQGAAAFRFKRARVLIRFAIARRYLHDDPTVGVHARAPAVSTTLGRKRRLVSSGSITGWAVGLG
jgi:hypothetical protein